VRKIILTLAVAALLVGATGATAGSLADKEDTILYKINSAMTRGEIDYDTALMYRFLALSPTGLKNVPARYHAEYYAEDPMCGTPVYLELMARWPRMRSSVKNEIMGVCGCDPFAPTPSDGGTRYRFLPGFSVYANYGGFTVYHYDSQEKDGGTNFRIHWVEEGPHGITNKDDINQNGVPDMIESYARDYEKTWTTWWADKWFKPPPGVSREDAYLPLKDYYPAIPYPPDEEWDYGGNDRWDAYLGQFTGGVIGMTTGDPFEFPDTFRDDRTPYFMDRRSYDASEPVTVAHESAHGVQYMIDVVESSATAVPRWYFEASATWGQEEVYPGDPGAQGRANNFLGNTLQPIDAPADGAGYTAVIFNYFLNDWEKRYWIPPDWVPLEDKEISGALIRNVWRALAKGDEWYTDDPTVNRESKEAMGYLIQLHRPKYQYLDGRIFKDTFEYWTTWNWLTGDRYDGKHYKYRFTTVTPQNTWSSGELPLVKFKPPEAYNMNHLGHGFYRFNNPPGWAYALITFAGDEDNPPDSKDWGGAIYVTKDGSTWTGLNGTAGQPTLMFTPEDKGIIQIRNPGQYQAIVAIFSNVSFDGDSLPFEYSYIQTGDTRPPAVASGIGIMQANPDFIEVLIGADEEIFGKAEAEVYFTSNSGKKRAEIVPVTAAEGNMNFKGKFILDIGDKGTGELQWRAADSGGNIVSGKKDFSAGFLAMGGGTVGSETASLKLAAGAVNKPTLFLIAPEEKKVVDVAAAAAPVGEGPTVETVGPAYEFNPGWARLAKPAEVALSYEGLEVSREDYLSVYRWTGSSWEDLAGTIDKRNRRVVAVADRLGKFVLGYGEKKNTTPPSGKPMSFGLFQNYPNPARDGTVIKFALPAQAEVELVVYDLSGRRVATVAKDVRSAGVYEQRYGLTDDGGKPLPAGVYLYRLSAGSDVATKKMVIAR
jgi:hypothetical protein